MTDIQKNLDLPNHQKLTTAFILYMPLYLIGRPREPVYHKCIAPTRVLMIQRESVAYIPTIRFPRNYSLPTGKNFYGGTGMARMKRSRHRLRFFDNRLNVSGIAHAELLDESGCPHRPLARRASVRPLAILNHFTCDNRLLCHGRSKLPHRIQWQPFTSVDSHRTMLSSMLASSLQSIPEFLRSYWPVAACSFGMSLIATPICRAYARKRGIVDRPDDFLKPHKKPIPYLGGVAIYLGWAIGILTALFFVDVPLRTRIIAGVLIGGSMIMGVGLFDDLRMMPPRIKLALNLIVGAILLYVGVGRGAFPYAMVRIGESEHWLPIVYAIPFSLFVIVGACNATNLIDGLDGLCGGVLGIISVGFFVLATHMALWAPDTALAHERIVLSLAMLGAAFGFLPYNRNPATIFMGDAGSMLLGLNAAVLILLFSDTGILRWTFGAIMVFGLPIADMVLTLLRRWRNGKPVMLGDRSHFYDQLVDRGFTVRQVVKISYALTAVFVIIGCITAIGFRTRYAVLIYGVAFAVFLTVIFKFNMVGLLPPEQRGTPKNKPEGHDE